MGVTRRLLTADTATAQPGDVLTHQEDGDCAFETPDPGGPAGEAFPVGAVFLATVATNPATLLGYGTWTAIGAGRVLVGVLRVVVTVLRVVVLRVRGHVGCAALPGRVLLGAHSMTHALPTLAAAALVLVACASQAPKTCTQEARAALTALYEKAAVQVVEEGACDASVNVDDCPAMQTLMLHMAVAQKALCE